MKDHNSNITVVSKVIEEFSIPVVKENILYLLTFALDKVFLNNQSLNKY